MIPFELRRDKKFIVFMKKERNDNKLVVLAVPFYFPSHGATFIAWGIAIIFFYDLSQLYFILNVLKLFSL